jgi:hypothetical protein
MTSRDAVGVVFLFPFLGGFDGFHFGISSCNCFVNHINAWLDRELPWLGAFDAVESVNTSVGQAVS